MERDAALGIVPLQGLEQAYHAGVHQRAEIVSGRQPAVEVARHALDERQIAGDDILGGVARLDGRKCGRLGSGWTFLHERT